MARYTTAQLVALEAAYARGVRRVTHNGKTVEYDSAREMKAKIEEMKRDLGLATGAPRKSRIGRFNRDL